MIDCYVFIVRMGTAIWAQGEFYHSKRGKRSRRIVEMDRGTEERISVSPHNRRTGNERSESAETFKERWNKSLGMTQYYDEERVWVEK